MCVERETHKAQGKHPCHLGLRAVLLWSHLTRLSRSHLISLWSPTQPCSTLLHICSQMPPLYHFLSWFLRLHAFIKSHQYAFDLEFIFCWVQPLTYSSKTTRNSSGITLVDFFLWVPLEKILFGLSEKNEFKYPTLTFHNLKTKPTLILLPCPHCQGLWFSVNSYQGLSIY